MYSTTHMALLSSLLLSLVIGCQALEKDVPTIDSLMSNLLGTWTLQTHATSDLGSYRGNAFVVMHVMANPTQSYSCKLDSCGERSNKICQRDQCVDIESTISEWSDVSVFYQFGYEIQTGIYPFRSHVMHNTSGWLGPYDMVLPQRGDYDLYGVYVTTPETEFLRMPENATVMSKETFDKYAGAAAVQSHIHLQTKMSSSGDPYQSQLGTCEKGDIRPTLPRFHIHKTSLAFEFFLWDLPPPSSTDRIRSQDDSAHKLWPAIQKHLPDFPVVGPYCYDSSVDTQTGNGAFAINVHYNYQDGKNNTWKLTAGCVDDLPCWKAKPDKKQDGGGSDGTPGQKEADMIMKALQLYGLYIALFGLVVSLTFNCQLSYQLQQQQQRMSIPIQAHVGDTPQESLTLQQRSLNDLEQPLLGSDDENQELEETIEGESSTRTGQEEEDDKRQADV